MTGFFKFYSQWLWLAAVPLWLTIGAPAAPLTLSVSQFFGKPNFNFPTVTYFSQKASGFAPVIQFDKAHWFSDGCSTILNAPNAFALNRMSRRGRISGERLETFLKHGVSAEDPEQVTLFELISTYETLASLNVFGDYPDDEVKFVEFLYPNAARVTLRKATFSSVSAQTLDPESEPGRPRWIRRKMPFQEESRFASFPALSPHTFAWEWKRAAQSEKELIDRLGPPAVLEEVQELLALGGNLEDAIVYVHSIGRASTSLYERYGFQKIAGFSEPGDQASPGKEESDHCLLMRPLASFLLDPKFAPHRFLEKTRDLMQIIHYRLNEFDLLRFFREIRRVMRVDLDFRGPGHQGHGPIIAYDRSPTVELLVWKALSRFGISDYANPVADYLTKTQFLYQEDDAYLVDRGPNPEMLAEPRSRSEISLSNLNPSRVIHDPTYVKSVLVGYFGYYKRRFQQQFPSSYVGHELAKLDFTVFTSDERVSQVLSGLGAKRQIVPYYSFEMDGPQTNPLITKREPKIAWGHTFRVEKIDKFRVDLATLGSAFLERAEFCLTEGVWEARLELRRSILP